MHVHVYADMGCVGGFRALALAAQLAAAEPAKRVLVVLGVRARRSYSMLHVRTYAHVCIHGIYVSIE